MDYNIIKIDVCELIRMNYKKGIDLADPVIYQIVAQMIAQPENAAFHQLIMINGGKHEDKKALLKDIIHMDLSGVKSFGNTIKELFDDGIKIRFDFGEDFDEFVAYDKSNSMARAKQIYFVRKSIRDDLHKRLMLDINDIELINSKLYSYRGLYYSDSARIEDERLVLNEKTVIVIEDCYVKKTGKTIYTARKSEIQEDENNGVKYDFFDYELTEKDKFNQFDGEGIISPEYAKIISLCLNKEVNSFQIRLPFGKGMLHSVDWKAMLIEMAEKNKRIIDLNSIFIEDIYKQKRCLGEAEIILTRSMFKCEKWLNDFCTKNSISDPMKYYFDKLKEYDHALYISGMDANIRNTGLVRFTYQFINPLDINDEQFNKIVEKHCNLLDKLNLESIANNDSESINTLEKVGYNEFSENHENEGITADFGIIKSTESWAKVLKMYPRFISDRYVKEKVEDLRKGLIKQIVEGRIYVKGELRYLSGDLFYFMLHLCTLVNNEESKVFAIETLASKAILENCVYLPGFPNNMDGDVALFRNPHLSRNEECVAHIFRTDDENDFYKYFRHLNRIVMISYKSLNAMALGGADFDGDEVKVITDGNIIKSVKKGIHGSCKQSTFKERKENIIKIPAPKAENSELSTTVDSETVINTFDSSIGIISNNAIRIGMKEYHGNEEEQNNYKNGCAKCTILTGLEIDAAKTGEHPYLKILPDKIEMDCELDYISVMKLLKSKPWKIRKNDEGEFEFEQGTDKIIVIRKYDGDAPGILKLLYKYCEAVCNDRAAVSNFKASDDPEKLFYGNNSSAGTISIDSTAGRVDNDNKKIIKIIRDYKDIQEAFKANRKGADISWGNKLFNLVRFNHDGFEAAFSCSSDKTVRDVINEAIVSMEQCLKSRKRADERLAKIKELKWIMTPKCKRRGKLDSILDVKDKAILSKEVVELLTDFRNRNFLVLEYCIEYAKNNLPDNNEFDEDNCFYQLCLDCLKQNMNADLWKTNLIAAARKEIAQVAKCNDLNDLKEAVKFVIPYRKKGQCDGEGEFFWNVFTGEEIIANVR